MHCRPVGSGRRAAAEPVPSGTVPGPSDHRSARRELSRARTRRRRLGAAGGLLALVIALGVILIASGSGSVPGRTGNSSASSPGQTGSARTTAGVQARARTNARQAAENANIARLARLGRPVYCAGPRGNAVAFTFDDGPGPYSHYALKKLRAAHERATFFVVGRSIDFFPTYLRREVPLGAIGDHTYTHPVLTSLPTAAVTSEITRTARRIEAAGGGRVHLFRPPYGARDPRIDAVAKQLGLLEILWNVDSADSLGANYAGITRNVEAGLHPGSIILMHENRGQTIRALTTLLPVLHQRHLHSVSLPELLASDPPSAGQLRQGPAGCGHAVLHGSGG
jgi:peptidoglycan/xylan/chitin deacetylase (PgdA/CDA1 family)